MTKRFATLLMAGSAVTALSAPHAFAQGAAAAAPPTSAQTVAEIVVTGTSIRGVAPVGATVSAVGQAEISRTADQTVQQVLQNVPAVVGLQSAGQGAFGSADGAGVDAPTIHGLGASASNQTLIILDGHRMPLSGLNHELVDPNAIPTLALQRVEVLADGASSIYGSDAVAGVINFITRKSYDGFEAQGQAGFGRDYHTYSGGFIGGTTWDKGSAWVAYSYDYRSDLLAGDRSFTAANHLAQGGSNLASYNCGAATLKIGSTYYPSPYATTSTLPSSGAGVCDYTGLADLLPSENRNSVMARINEDVNDRLSVSGDTLYSNLYEITQNVRGTATTTIFSGGAQANPYFVTPAGMATTPASETVYWDANALLGPGAHTNVSDETFEQHLKATYKLTDSWQAVAEGTVGEVTSRQSIIGAVNGSATNLALNGTTNGSGSLTTPSVPGTSIIVTQALSAANALDPFLTAGNPTPASVLAGIQNSTQTRLSRHDMEDATLKLDGSLFNLPAGPVKLAVGGEFTHYTLHLDITQPLGIGPATLGSSTTNLDYARTVMSGFGELLIPVVSPEQNIPLMRKIDLSVSGRIDHYNDFGSTENPKFGGNWEVISGLKLRGAYATSFTAPALTSVGQPVGQWGVTGETGFGNYGLGAVNVPVAANALLSQLPGCATSTTCQLGSSTIGGLQISGGNRYLKPQTGKSWSTGVDYTPDFLKGLKLSLTYWDDEIVGGVTSPTPSVAVNSPTLLNKVLTVYPTGATPAQIAALTGGLTQTSALPSTVYFVYNYQQQNVLNLWLQGIDYSVSYGFSTSYGRFTVQTAGSYETEFNEQIGAGTPIYSVLNTTGANTTFPSIQFQTRSGLSWDSNKGLTADVFWNHTGAYKNWSGTTVTPIIHNALGAPIGGGDTVAANDTFDVHVAYNFTSPNAWVNGSQVYVDVQNIADKAPPFYNTAAGYDTYAGNPIGRVVSVGLHKKF